jgi:hypothetical protein
VIAQAASSASASQPPPGLFLLAWGLFATVVGLGAVTNYRGFAEKFAQQAYSSRRLWRWQRHEQSVRLNLAGVGFRLFTDYAPVRPGTTAGRPPRTRVRTATLAPHWHQPPASANFPRFSRVTSAPTGTAPARARVACLPPARRAVAAERQHQP